MSRTKTLFAGSAMLAGVSAALLTGGIAKADTAPAPAPVPGLPGIGMFEQFLNPGMAPQLLQAAQQTLTGAQAATPAQPAQQPLATGSLNLPNVASPAATNPATAPAATNPLLPTLTPAITPETTPASTATGPAGGLLPSAEVTMPQVPGMPIPLPQTVNIPGSLGGLMPVGNQVSAPVAGAVASPATVASIPAIPGASSVAAVPGALNMISGLP